MLSGLSLTNSHLWFSLQVGFIFFPAEAWQLYTYVLAVYDPKEIFSLAASTQQIIRKSAWTCLVISLWELCNKFSSRKRSARQTKASDVHASCMCLSFKKKKRFHLICLFALSIAEVHEGPTA